MKSKKDQAAEAKAAAEKALEDTSSYTGDDAVKAATEAEKAAGEAKKAAEAAYEAAKTEGLSEEEQEKAAKLVQEADDLLKKAQDAVKKAYEGVDADSVRKSVTDELAAQDEGVDKDSYTASSYAAYKEAYDNFLKVAAGENVTADDILAARDAVMQAYHSLKKKDPQKLTVTAANKTDTYTALLKKAKTYKALTVKDNTGKLSYTKAAGSSAYASVDPATGVITLKKGTPAGVHTVKVLVKAEATDDLLEAKANSTVKITVKDAVSTMKGDGDPKGSRFSVLRLRSTKQTKATVTLKWSKTKKAVKYVVYGNRCGKTYKMKKVAVTKKNTYKVKKAGKKLTKGKYYKFIVVALDKNNFVVSTSKVIHAATAGTKKGNHKAVEVTKKVIKKAAGLKKGKSLKLKAKLVRQAKKKVVKHCGLRYESTNTKIATVSKKGVIKGKAKGTCFVYAYAQDGVFKKIKVKVK